MTTYFSAVQRRVLKFIWIPVLIYLAFYLPGDIHQRDFYRNTVNQLDYVSNVLFVLPFSFAVGYEFLMRNKYKELIFLMLIALAGSFLIEFEFFSRFKAQNGSYGLNSLLLALFVNFLLLIVRAYLLGGPQIWQRALAGLLVTYFTATLSSHIFTLTNPFHITNFWLREVITLPFRVLFPVLYFTGLFLADNLMSAEGYLAKLQSKLERISSKEYLVLYLFLSMICLFGATAFGYQLGILFSKIGGQGSFQAGHYSIYVVIIFLLSYATVCVAGAYLLRNVVISRMNTIGSDNGWLYVLHYSVLLNIIPVIVWSNAASVHKTEEENAVFYLTKVPSSIGMVIMCLGAVCSFTSGFYILSAMSHSSSGYILAFSGICIFSSFMHTMLRKFKDAVYGILILNVISVLLLAVISRGEGAYIGSMLMTIYLSFYVLIEVFHPSLDNYQLPEETYQGDKNPGEISF
ncbi:hypothetical protein [Chitinophaga pinensis]|uniref:Uncharacterized protein n=1 Tax=Chitinophaga pinensis (strain ATCC 43595 / DSM 2588 / LMG 13176 / NBRC 15968 / NCIMB 11800 / UQM 2034) TaxID=485918 RepID=A0A979G285_CHIPD|nr:hypothetical protein [Chitinophaga pinensis]ACU59288.1 hypothetical protein Cpin_1792 [Chitinophaga pinensis DSM 2588]